MREFEIGFYLAGPMAGCTDEELAWRDEAEAAIRTKMPKLVRRPEGTSMPLSVWNPERHEMWKAHMCPAEWRNEAIADGDKAMIERSHFVLVRMHKPSIGTAMEILHAWNLGRNIWSLDPRGEGSDSHWFRRHVNPARDDGPRNLSGKLQAVLGHCARAVTAALADDPAVPAVGTKRIYIPEVHVKEREETE